MNNKFQLFVENLTYQSAQEMFFLRGRVEGLSPKTMHNYEYVLKTFSRFMEKNNINSDYPVGSLDHNLLRRYFLSLQEKGLSKVSISDHYRCLKAFFNFLIREENLTENPLRKIAAPKIPKQFPYLLK